MAVGKSMLLDIFNQTFVVFVLILRPELHNFTPNGNY